MDCMWQWIAMTINYSIFQSLSSSKCSMTQSINAHVKCNNIKMTRLPLPPITLLLPQIHPFIHPSIHSFIHPFIYPFIPPFIHLSIHSSIYSTIHPFISIHPSIHSLSLKSADVRCGLSDITHPPTRIIRLMSLGDAEIAYL